MSERLNLVEERRAIGRLRALLRAAEQMKAARRPTQLWYYLLRNEKCTGIRRDNTVTHDPLFLVTE